MDCRGYRLKYHCGEYFSFVDAYVRHPRIVGKRLRLFDVTALYVVR